MTDGARRSSNRSGRTASLAKCVTHGIDVVNRALLTAACEQAMDTGRYESRAQIARMAPEEKNELRAAAVALHEELMQALSR